jgi:hypothetical protein
MGSSIRRTTTFEDGAKVTDYGTVLTCSRCPQRRGACSHIARYLASKDRAGKAERRQGERRKGDRRR